MYGPHIDPSNLRLRATSGYSPRKRLTVNRVPKSSRDRLLFEDSHFFRRARGSSLNSKYEKYFFCSVGSVGDCCHVEMMEVRRVDMQTVHHVMSRGHIPATVLKPTGIQIATKSFPGPTTRKHRKLIGVKTRSMSSSTKYSFYFGLLQEVCVRCHPIYSGGQTIFF